MISTTFDKKHIFSSVVLLTTGNFPERKKGLDRVFDKNPRGFSPKSPGKKEKNFKKGIDFMEKPRYNAYLYQYVSGQEV
jgi:hypothetical protein